jgi:uncharacterized membrane protein YdjX (TVP38/TMEM64 family)
MASKRNNLTAGALGGLLGLVLLWWMLPTLDGLIGVLEWTRTAGPKGYATYALIYFVATLLVAPASFLQGSAGFLFGPLWGWLIASLLSTAFGTVNFLLARTVLRKWVEARVARDERFESINTAIGDGGVYLVALLRVPPVSPYNVVCYVLGLTQVSLSRYVLGTWLGSLVPVTLYCYLGSTVGSLTELMEGGGATDAGWVQGLGLVTTLIATAGVARYANIALKKALATPEGPAAGAEPASGTD